MEKEVCVTGRVDMNRWTKPLWYAGLLAASLIIAPASAESVAPELDRQSRNLLQHLEAESGGTLSVRWNERTCTPSVLEGRLSKPSNHSPQWIATEFVRRVKNLYGLENPNHAMRVVEVERRSDSTRVRMEHLLYGTPVWGDELSVHIDGHGIIRRVEGTIHPRLEKQLFHRPLRPAISAHKATAKALAAVKDQGTLAGPPEARLYYLPSRSGTPPVYVVTIRFVERDAGDRQLFIHGITGRVIASIPEAPDGASR